MKILLKKLGLFSVGPIVGAFLGLITVPLVTFFISTDEYGRCSMFTLAQSAMSMLVYLGMDQAFVREFHGEKGRTDHLLVNAIFLPICITFLVDAAIIWFSKQVSIWLFDTPDERIAVYMLAIMLPFMVLENFGLLKIRMEERGLQYSLFTILLKLLTLLMTVGLFICYEKSFRSVVYAVSISEILTGCIIFLTTMRKVPFFSMSIDRLLLKRMLKFGIPLMPAAILGWALTSMDKIMLRSLCSYSELGLYSAAYKIVSILGIVQSSFTLFWPPVAYRWYESGKENKYFTAINDIVAMVMAALCISVLLCKDIVALILGKNFAQAIYIFPFIMLYPIMYTMSETTAVAIGFARKTGYNILVSVLSGGINIILNYLLIPAMGGKGAAMATGLSYTFFFWSRTMISRSLWYKFPLKKYVFFTIIILLNCYCHTFIENWIPYVLSAFCLLIMFPVLYKIFRAYRFEFRDEGEIL